MKRIHIHLRVDDLAAATTFYTALLGASPTVEKPDYVKWSLADPRLNLAISYGNADSLGVNHLGIQVDTDTELSELSGRLSEAHFDTHAETSARCCYAVSDKQWARDPAGTIWELFRTKSDSKSFGRNAGPSPGPAGTARHPICGQFAPDNQRKTGEQQMAITDSR